MNGADPPYDSLEIGTPQDYTSDIYKVYLEVGEYNDTALEILRQFLEKNKNKSINRLAHGYEVELPIQNIPEVIKMLCQKNIAIYQVIRYAKTNKTWE